MQNVLLAVVTALTHKGSVAVKQGEEKRMQEDTEHFFFFSCIAAERHTVTSALGSCFQSTCWFTWCEMKQMFNFAGPTHESMDFCYLSVMFCRMFELFWKIYLMKNQKTSKKVGIQLRKTGILQTLWSSFPLEQVCCQCCFECSCCCVPTVRRNDETIVLRKCVIS